MQAVDHAECHKSLLLSDKMQAMDHTGHVILLLHIWSPTKRTRWDLCSCAVKRCEQKAHLHIAVHQTWA